MPICLLSNIYKVLTKRLEKILDQNQSEEQAEFRSRYSTTVHIHVVNQPKEKCREYNIPFCIAFVDYENAFDSVQTQAILTLLQEQRIEDVYSEARADRPTYRKQATRSTSGDEYDREIPYRPSCLRQRSTHFRRVRRLIWETRCLKIDCEATSTCDRDTAPETETKTRRFKEKSRPDGHNWSNTDTSSKVTLEHA